MIGTRHKQQIQKKYIEQKSNQVYCISLNVPQNENVNRITCDTDNKSTFKL